MKAGDTLDIAFIADDPPVAMAVFRFPNGMLAVTDGKEQIPELQGACTPELLRKITQRSCPKTEWNGCGPVGPVPGTPVVPYGTPVMALPIGGPPVALFENPVPLGAPTTPQDGPAPAPPQDPPRPSVWAPGRIPPPLTADQRDRLRHYARHLRDARPPFRSLGIIPVALRPIPPLDPLYELCLVYYARTDTGRFARVARVHPEIPEWVFVIQSLLDDDSRRNVPRQVREYFGLPDEKAWGRSECTVEWMYDAWQASGINCARVVAGAVDDFVSLAPTAP